MSITPEEEHKRVIAGLQLLRNEPKGQSPTRHEITLWIVNSLDAGRAKEVVSWVANHPGYNQVWLELLAENRANTSEQTNKHVGEPAVKAIPRIALSRSIKKRILELSKSQMFTGALAAGLLAIFVVPVMLLETSTQELMDESYSLYANTWSTLTPPDIQPRQSKGLKDLLRSAVVQDYTTYHIRYGFGRFIEHSPVIQKTNWKGYGSGLPAEFLNCKDTSVAKESLEQCRFAANFFADLGEWSLMTYSVCLDQNVDDSNDFWRHQLSVAKRLQEDFSEVDVAKKDPNIRNFNNERLRNKSDMCRFSKYIVTRYL